ncbi:MAG: RidA family protein [Eubacterium sp.]|nr:RidA family protein [Eubacterium sp.]
MSIAYFRENERLSYATEFDNVIYLSGLVGDVSLTDLKEQAVSLFAEIEKELDRAGSDKAHLLAITVYLNNRDDFDDFNEVYEKWVSDVRRPARTCIGANLMKDSWLVEMTVTAVKK